MRLFLIILIAAAVFFAVARKPRSATDQAGNGFHAALNSNEHKTTLTIASYNIQTGKSFAGIRDISKSAAVISHADIVGVQEVYAKGWLNRFGMGTPQSETLAKAGPFEYLFSPTRTRWFREDRGNLILSKLPAQDWKIKMLPDQSGKSYRNMTIANFLWQGQTITIINTHLHTGVGREEQLAVVLTEFEKYSRAILLGDFNTTRDSKLLQRLFEDDLVVDAVAVAGLNHNANSRIDWILTKGFDIQSGEFLEKGVSDHPYYEVTISLKL